MRYAFADCELDTDQYALYRSGKSYRIRPKAFQVLVYLLQHRKRVVTKQELAEEGWPDQFVTDAVVENTLKAVRRVVGDSGHAQDIIQTLRGYGYRFVASVIEYEEAQASAERQEPIPNAESVEALDCLSEEETWCCPVCQHMNRTAATEDIRSCIACRTQLPLFCPWCQAANLPQTNFCISCEKELAEFAATTDLPQVTPPSFTPYEPLQSDVTTTAHHCPTAERRQLTVLFCDLIDSTPLAGKLDLDDFHEVIRTYQDTCAGVIQRFDGHITQYLGDGLLASFGYPFIHEDNAYRAIRAGLGIVAILDELNTYLTREYGVKLAVRIGIHTGLVIIENSRNGGQHKQAAFGEALHIAARIQNLATPNTVVISAATARLLQGYFVMDTLGFHHLKGVAEPVQLLQVLRTTGAQSRLEATASGGLTPLVGRQTEIALLMERWSYAKEGAGRVVLLSGEAGIGKSRLVQELKEKAVKEGAAPIEFRCSPYHQNSALYPVVDHLQRLLQFERDETPQSKLAKLESRLSCYRFPQADTLPLFARLFGLPHPANALPLTMTPQKQKEKMQEALVAWLLEETEQNVVCWVWEDLHWADPSTLELLHLCLDQIPTTRLLVLMTCRSEFKIPWPIRSHITQLAVERLLSDEAETLIARVTQLPLPAELVTQIVQRADGVPLYLEELTRMVLESDLVTRLDDRYELTGEPGMLTIPTTLQDSLMARLNRLSRGKHTAQQGAVIGRSFTYEVLAAMSSANDDELRCGLAQLVDAELLYQRGMPPDAVYTFKHAMIQDAAYQSLVRNTRRALHGRVADVLVERFAEPAAAEPERIAYHFDQAGRVAEAIANYQTAGKLAAAYSAHEEAIVHLKRAIELVDSLPSYTDADQSAQRVNIELELQLAIGPSLMAVRGYSAPEVRRVYERAAELCETAEASPRLAPIWFGLWTHAVVTGALPKALELGVQLLQLAEETKSEDLVLEAHVLNGVTRSYTGPMKDSLHHLNMASAMYDKAKYEGHARVYGQDPMMASRSYIGLALWWLGLADRAGQTVEEAIDFARQIKHPRSLAFALANGARCHLKRGDFVRCAEVGREAADISVRQGYPDFKAMGELHVACAEYRLGGGMLALERMQRSLADLSSVGNSLSMPFYRSTLADALSMEGRFDDAWASLTMADAALAKHVNDCDEAEFYRVKGLVAWRQAESGDTAAEPAELWLQKALDTARHQGASSWRLLAAATLARYLLTYDGGVAAKASAGHLLAEAMASLDEGKALHPWLDAAYVLEQVRQ